MLETLYTGSSTWLSVTPTSLPATTFTGNVTMSGAILDLGTNSLKFTNTSSVVRTMSQAILEALYTGSNNSE